MEIKSETGKEEAFVREAWRGFGHGCRGFLKLDGLSRSEGVKFEWFAASSMWCSPEDAAFRVRVL